MAFAVLNASSGRGIARTEANLDALIVHENAIRLRDGRSVFDDKPKIETVKDTSRTATRVR